MIVKGMHYAGVLSPTNTTVVKDATLYHHMDMDCPEVVITPSNAILKQHNVLMQLKCRDQILNNGSNYTLIDSVFSNATQELSVGAYVAPDHSALGFFFQLHNASLATANVTAFNSTSFFGSKEMLQQIAQSAIQGSLPPINKLLKRSPVVLCGGGTSSCSLVPFVPNPQLVMTPALPPSPGFVEMQWWCGCGDTGFYQHCRGFACPELS